MLGRSLILARTTAKTLMRGKAFWAVGIIFPFISVLLINVWASLPYDYQNQSEKICYLEAADEQMAYEVDFNCFPIKIYDEVCNTSSQKAIEELGASGMFQIFVVEAGQMAEDGIRMSVEQTALKDNKVGAILWLRDPFETSELYSVGEDERFGLLEDILPIVLAGYDSTGRRGETVILSTLDKGEVNFSATRSFAFCVAFASIAFIFGGVIILSTVISEKQYNVLSRIMLTGAGRAEYFLSKLILSLGLVFIQAFVMTAGFMLFVETGVNLSAMEFFTILFMQGIVFNLISLCVGLFTNSVAAASVMAFCIWSISALVSGTYFDISTAGDSFKKISALMPQRWALLSATRFSDGDLSGYSLIFCAALAYLVIIFVIGLLGLRFGEDD